jgi:DNA-binding response OmpR family regulator
MTKATRRIAFLDDSLTVRVILKNVLTEAGHEPFSCETWAELDKVVRTTELDLVLLDVQMPRVSGPPIAYVLKKRHPTLKVVFVSDAEEGALRRLTAETGADGYIRKSCDGSQMAREIERHLDGSAPDGDSE